MISHLDLSRIVRIAAISLLVEIAALLLLAPGATQAGGTPPFIVNSTGDEGDANPGDTFCDTGTGACTLRAAIQESNVAGDTNFIHFDIPAEQRVGSTGDMVRTIQPATVLPAISFPAAIDARTQPGYSASPLVHLDGSLLTEGMGLYVDSNDTTVAGLRISGFPDNNATPTQYGAQIFSSSNAVDNLYTENVLGLNPDGQPTGTDIGVWLYENSRTTVANSVISGNLLRGVWVDHGIDIDINGNLIGLDESGSSAVANAIHGVFVFQASNVTVGAYSGSSQGSFANHNVISGNGIAGVQVAQSTNAIISGNYIGTDTTGTQDVGNLHYGVFMQEAPDALIVGNVVSGNGSAPFDAGIFVYDPAPAVEAPTPSGVTPGGALEINENLIGTNAACDAAVPNENGLVVIDQPRDDRFFWDEVLIDGNTISGNLGTAPAPAAGTVTAEGSDMISGDGIVWGAKLPPGENGLMIGGGAIGSDCSGEPLGNSGNGIIAAMEPARTGAVSPAGFAALQFFFGIFDVDLSHNDANCVVGDVFVDTGPGRLGAAGDLGDILGLTAQWENVTANSCGENGVEVNQRTSVLSYTEESNVTLDQIRANDNGQNGVAINQTLISGGNLPPTNILLSQANNNGANGHLIDANADEAFTMPVSRKTNIRGSQADGNGGHGVRLEMLGGGLSQIDVDAPPVVIEDSTLTDNGGAGASVGSFVPPAVFSPVSLAEPQPTLEINYTIISGNDGPGLEVLELAPPGRLTGTSRVTGAGTVSPHTVIYNNGGPAIDLGGDGPTANDPLDADVGPNGLTNHPVLTSATGGGVMIEGIYQGAPNTEVTLRFYSNTACENGGEGQFYIGSADFPTGDEGFFEFGFSTTDSTPGRFVAATATGPEGLSEFSPCIEGEGLGGISGDTDCDKDVDSVDGLNVLRDVAGFPPSECIDAGNVDCDADRDSIDALFILRDVAALPVNLPKGCPDIGG